MQKHDIKNDKIVFAEKNVDLEKSICYSEKRSSTQTRRVLVIGALVEVAENIKNIFRMEVSICIRDSICIWIEMI